MCCLSLSELSAETRNEWGLPETDPVMMGANDMSAERRERRRICDELDDGRMTGDVPKCVYETTAANRKRHMIARIAYWALATATGFLFGAIVASAVCMWSLS